jgi:hypothetical protein
VSDAKFLIQGVWYKVSDARCLIQTRCLIQDVWYKVCDTRCLIQGFWCKVSDTRCLIQGVWYKVSDTKYLIQDVWYKVSGTRCCITTLSWKKEWRDVARDLLYRITLSWRHTIRMRGKHINVRAWTMRLLNLFSATRPKKMSKGLYPKNCRMVNKLITVILLSM